MTARRIRVLSLSTVFPNPLDRNNGIFVYRRLVEIARQVELTVIVPVPAIDFGNPQARWFSAWRLKRKRRDAGMDIYHVRWLYLPFGVAINSILLFLRLAPLLFFLHRKFPFNIIDAHFGYPEGVAAAALGRLFSLPYLITMRGNETMHAGYRWRRRLMSWALRGADRVITVSEALRAFAIELGVNPERVITISNGIDSTMFYPRDREIGRERFQLRSNQQAILTAGYLIERKGHHRLIRALHALRQRWHTDQGMFPLLLVAGGPGREGKFADYLYSIVKELGMSEYVRFLGPLEPVKLAELMAAADLFCLASAREGWPNVVHEAMGCGTPVVATRVGGIPEMVPSSEYGLVVQLDDTALEAGLAQALRQDWDRELIANWAQSRSWSCVAQECVEVISEVAASSRRALG